MSNELLLEKLEDDLIDKLDQFPGVAGVSIKDLINGNDISINGNEIFPTASIIKIHILTYLLKMAESGSIDINKRISVDKNKFTGIFDFKNSILINKINIAGSHQLPR